MVGSETQALDMEPGRGVIGGKTQSSVEMLYTLETAAELIPFPNKAALTQWLCQHPDVVEKRYRKAGRRCYRMLLESEILKIRNMLVVTDDPFRRFAARTPRGRGPIATIMQRALDARRPA